jgi:hypothetical protein
LQAAQAVQAALDPLLIQAGRDRVRDHIVAGAGEGIGSAKGGVLLAARTRGLGPDPVDGPAVGYGQRPGRWAALGRVIPGRGAPDL